MLQNMLLKLNYIERRSEDQNLNGAQAGRHLAAAIESCRLLDTGFQTAYRWLNKELVEVMQSVQMYYSKCSRGALGQKEWNLVMESAYRNVGFSAASRGVTEDSHEWTVLQMKINWCRSMQWFEGMPVTDGGEMNFLVETQRMQECYRNLSYEDRIKDQIVDLHACMWRNVDLQINMESVEMQVSYRWGHFGEVVGHLGGSRALPGQPGSVSSASCGILVGSWERFGSV